MRVPARWMCRPPRPRQRPLALALGVLLPSLVALSTCARASQDGGPRLHAVSSDGTAVTLRAAPRRIVVAGTPLYTYCLIDLGAGDRIVGVTSSVDNPKEVAATAKIGPSLGPSIERTLALQPDLVVGAGEQVKAQLERLGVPVWTGGRRGGQIDRLDEIFRLLRSLGALLDERPERVEALVARIRGEVAEVAQKVGARPRPRVAVLYVAPGSGGAPFVAGRGTPEDELITLAGGQNVFADLSLHPQVSIEHVLQRDPDVVVTDRSQLASLAGHPLLRQLQAVQRGRAFGTATSLHSSSRVASAVRELAEHLHPDAFGR